MHNTLPVLEAKVSNGPGLGLLTMTAGQHVPTTHWQSAATHPIALVSTVPDMPRHLATPSPLLLQVPSSACACMMRWQKTKERKWNRGRKHNLWRQRLWLQRRTILVVHTNSLLQNSGSFDCFVWSLDCDIWLDNSTTSFRFVLSTSEQKPKQ